MKYQLYSHFDSGAEHTCWAVKTAHFYQNIFRETFTDNSIHKIHAVHNVMLVVGTKRVKKELTGQF